MRTPRFRHHGDDALGRQARVTSRGPIGAIALNDVGPAARSTAAAGDGGQRGDQRFELHHVGHVRRR